MALPLWWGAKEPKVLLLGEAWGQQEAMVGMPFVGASGQELWRLLGEAFPEAQELHQEALRAMRWQAAWVRYRDPWLEAAGVGFANVLNLRPPDNKLEALCTDKAGAGVDYPWPAMSQGKYLRRDLAGEAMERLAETLRVAKPNLVVALGNTACWAMLGMTAIGTIRGTVFEGLERTKVLPTFHPAAVLRQWSLRTIVLADLLKAERERKFPNLRRPQRQVLVSPTPAELAWGVERVAREARASGYLANDVETKARQITCISFAGSPSFALTIPFWDQSRKGWSFWETPRLERQAWEAVRYLLESKDYTILGQNYVYDLQYILPMGIRPWNSRADTMLLHHAHFPELQKGLGFLGSIYTDEPAWKLMRRQRKADQMDKRDE